ncbi:Hpt domain-containing protein [Cupriavidus basilensis]
MNPDQLRDASLLELFALEAQSQAEVLSAGLLSLERDPTAADQLEACMRAAHSLKGAARIVGLDGGVRVAHVMEDCLVAAQHGELRLRPVHIDALLHGTDLLLRLGCPPGGDPRWADQAGKAEIDALVLRMGALLAGEEVDADAWAAGHAAQHLAPGSEPLAEPQAASTMPVSAARPEGPAPDAVAGTKAAGPATQPSGLPDAQGAHAARQRRYARPVARAVGRGDGGDALAQAPRQRAAARPGGCRCARCRRLMRCQVALAASPADTLARPRWPKRSACSVRYITQQLSQRVTELSSTVPTPARGRLAHQIYDRAPAWPHAGPTADGLYRPLRAWCATREAARWARRSSPRTGRREQRQADRDILERAHRWRRLAHLLRNAADHGIERPEARAWPPASRPKEGRITPNARHKRRPAGDRDRRRRRRRGPRCPAPRHRPAQPGAGGHRGQAVAGGAARLPAAARAVSMRETVSEVSGRGVGLDAVQDMLRQVRAAASA